ncbi:GNAT family N-acetyltransferase [Microbacterium sp. LTA6]|uniref:GNAT family N-acetyltransferase n=1 Tax=Microbacterium sp. LTA6 TaxID=3129771 RepID=UPI0032518740
MSKIRITAWDATDTQLERSAELYASVFAEPPYGEDPETSRSSFIERVQRYALSHADFRFLIATHGDDVIGLVLGTGAAEGDWWRDRLTEVLSHEQQEEWLGEACFSIAELAVSPDFRREGAAEQLMDAVLENLPYETAILGCYAEALPARRLYARLGWDTIESGVHIGASPALEILGRRLR